MKRSLLFVALTVVVSGGCEKTKSNDGQYSGGGNPTPEGGTQAVRGAVNRTVDAAEMHDLFILMNYAKGASGHTPTSQETWELLNKPDGNRQLVKLIQDGLIVLVPTPGDEGLWAYEKDAPTKGGWVLTQVGESRVSAAEFANLQRAGM